MARPSCASDTSARRTAARIAAASTNNALPPGIDSKRPASDNTRIPASSLGSDSAMTAASNNAMPASAVRAPSVESADIENDAADLRRYSAKATQRASIGGPPAASPSPLVMVYFDVEQTRSSPLARPHSRTLQTLRRGEFDTTRPTDWHERVLPTAPQQRLTSRLSAATTWQLRSAPKTSVGDGWVCFDATLIPRVP